MGYYANRLYGQDAGGRARDITQGNRVTAKVRRFSSLFLAHMYSSYAHTSRSLTFLSSVPSPPSNHHICGSFCVRKLRQVLARSVSPLAGTDPPRLADLLLGFFFIHASAASHASLFLSRVFARRDFPASSKKGEKNDGGGGSFLASSSFVRRVDDTRRGIIPRRDRHVFHLPNRYLIPPVIN